MSLGALVGVVSFFTALVAGDLIQWPEASLASSRTRASAIVVVVPSVHSAVVAVELHARVVMLFPHLRGHLVAGYSLVSGFAAVVAYDVSLLCLLCGVLNRQVELRVHKFALRAIGTKPAKVTQAHDAAGMPVTTVRAMSTEPSVVPGAILDFRFWIYVQKRALLVTARVKARVKVALRHLRHVELVEEFALVALLAQAAKPVLAHNRPVPLNMPEGARGRLAAVALHIKTAHGSAGLVHTRERQRQRAQLLFEGHLQFEDNVPHFGHYLLHRINNRAQGNVQLQ